MACGFKAHQFVSPEGLIFIKEFLLSLLFTPFSIGGIELANRLVMTSMSTCFADRWGRVTKRLTDYYVTRATHGVGLVTVEEAGIHPQLPHIHNSLSIETDAFIPGLKTLVNAINEAGAAASLQIGLYFRQHINGFPRHIVSRGAPGTSDDCMELQAEETKGT